MIIKKLIQFTFACLTLTTLTSWSLPPSISRQRVTPQWDQETVEAAREKSQKKSRKPIADGIRNAYSARQKNKLASYAERDGFIWFDDKDNKETYFLSNFYPASIQVSGAKFSCAEAAFQAAKFSHKPDLCMRFTRLEGEEAWKLAKRHSYEQRSDWYKIRDNVMLEVLRAKFRQNANLAELLLATGDAYLVEHSERDAYWSDGGDGKGKNQLGQILMQVRGELGGVGEVAKPGKYRKFVSR